MALLTREEILAADDRTATETVPVPEWGGEVIVGVIGGDERDRFDRYRESRRSGDNDGIRGLLVALTCRDEHGGQLFQPADVAALGKKSSAALDRVFHAACRVNKIGAEAAEAEVKN